ncbi:MAG: hypothetical protein O7B35_07540 [Deltaproteobacteria bacterium]|nr:hypothetical protein [Deltaproteobacteria bacterium]
MELILTSFGLSHLGLKGDEGPSFGDINPFYRMPPLRMSLAGRLPVPDFAVLLLCDRVILDSETWERIKKDRYSQGYKLTAEVVKSLYAEGFIRIEDFNAIIADNRTLLEKMMERDLKRLDDWVDPLKESLDLWGKYVTLTGDFWRSDILHVKEFQPDYEVKEVSYETTDFDRSDIIKILHIEDNAHATTDFDRSDIIEFLHIEDNAHAIGVIGDTPYLDLLKGALKSSSKRRRSKYRQVLRALLTEYLAYVNANLVVSHTLGMGFHDWEDYAPFYRAKFLTIGAEERPGQENMRAVRKLFEVSFPEISFSNPRSLIKILTDKRITQLRELVEKAVRGDVEFDKEFANRTFQEVLRIEQKAGRVRKIVSWATLPLSFIPVVGSPLQKGVEEAAGHIVERKLKKDFRWFYLISEHAQQPRQLEEKRS